MLRRQHLSLYIHHLSLLLGQPMSFNKPHFSNKIKLRIRDIKKKPTSYLYSPLIQNPPNFPKVFLP